jgi:hypothetical protein
MPRKIQGYGWVPDLPDGRDLLYGAPAKPLAKLPPRVDLRPKCPPVYDQGQLGSCTANAIGAALQFDQIKQRQKTFPPRASSSTTTSARWRGRSTPTAAR